MAVGPRHVRILRTDNLPDIGTPASADKVLIIDLTDGELKFAEASTVGVTDHGGLAGLLDDDHTQYLNVSRHDADDHSSLTITESQITDLAHLTIEQVQDNLGTSFIVGGNNLTATYNDTSNTLTLAVDALIASDITSGTFADARIAQSSVTQHQAALTITESQISDLTHLTFDATLPAALTPDIAGATGVSGSPARRDHVHNVPADVAVGISNASTNTEGNSTSFSRANHTHAVTGFALTSHNHAASNITSGILAVARGGTGLGTYTTGNYINASGATTLQQRTPAQVLSDIGAAATVHTHAATDTTTGTFANARISESSVTQHQAALSITESQISDLAHLTLEQVQDNLGTSVLTAGDNISITYDDGANTITVAVVGSTTSPFLLMGA